MTICEKYGITREDVLNSNLHPMAKIYWLSYINMTPEEFKEWNDKTYEAVKCMANRFKKHHHKEPAV